ncbi:MAG: DUF4346 domain-containing protein [Nanoarchaeota archaeon]
MVEEIIVNSRKKSDWQKDESGYFLIRINKEKHLLEVQFRTPNKQLVVNFYGSCPEDLYYKIISKGLVSNLQHAAYLGSELQKAFIALKQRKKYVQDDEL